MSKELQQLRAWYDQCGESVLYRCKRLLGDEALAWDTTQEVFLRAYQAHASFHGGSVLNWLLTIADRRCFSLLKQRRRRYAILERLAQESLPQSIESIEPLLWRDDLIRRLLVHFDADVQRIVVLRFFEELEQEDIALRLGMSRKTVHRKLDRFFKSSRKLMAMTLNPVET